MSNSQSKLEGFDELERAFRNLEVELPKTVLRKAVKGGADKVLQAARSAAPELTGAIKGGLKVHRERSHTAGKVVYDVYPDPKKNDIFQKPIINPVRSKSDYAYYPASQEYGFFTRRPGGGMVYNSPGGETRHMEKVPGKFYMLTGAELAGEAAKQSIADDLLAEISAELGG